MAKQQQQQQVQQPVPAEEAAGIGGGDDALVVDFSTVPDQADLPVVPRGIYPASVFDVTFGYSQNGGNPMWTWIFELADQAGEYAGRKMYFHTPFVENMMPRVKKVLSRVAPELLNGPIKPEEIAEAGTLVGKLCRIRLDIGRYQGRQRNNVRDVLPAEANAGGAFMQAPQ